MTAGTATTTLTPAEARALILAGDVREPLVVDGALDLSGRADLHELPAHLTCARLDVSGSALTELPEHLTCDELVARDLPLRSVPATLRVKYRLVLDDCTLLDTLPEDLRVGSLGLRRCRSLRALPEGLDVHFLDAIGADALTAWPARGAVRYGHLTLRDCVNLTSLPDWLDTVAQLDLSGCVNLTALPAGLRVTAWIDVGGSGLTALPRGTTVPLRWRGVVVEPRVAFHPESITGRDVLATPNVEVRRVMMERMGPSRFVEEVGARVLDRDTDAGGERRLVRVPLEGDEDFVAVCVRCPSTGRSYVLRVPPAVRTCHEAAAW
ncbi:DUF6745 domain-containing protein, partial [Deinococcus pimensis]|uniref:DUF6745 domain-containing protein n=1 Tax=Deinococcus pimensis TaxID=309888 RepID=UPI000694FB6E